MRTSKNFFVTVLSAMTVLAISSCSDTEDVPIPEMRDRDEIRFTAATEYSRAGDITTNNLKSFNVYAYTNSADSSTLFMDNVTVNKTGTNNWTYTPVQYWPAVGTVDFYAYAPSTWVGTKGPLVPVPYDALAGTEDIVYAVCPDMKGVSQQPNAQVIFNFRHALSKLTFKLSSSDTTLAVRVSNVSMSNIMSKGNFNFPQASTSEIPSSETVGRWTDQNSPYTYVLYWSQALSDILTLTSTPTVIAPVGLGRGSVMYVLPQNLTYQSNGSGNDTYLALQCSLYDAKTGTKLWPNANTPKENIVEGSTFGDGLLKFPLSTSKFSAWDPGCHYIYNLVINSNEEMGAIEFGTPTVDTFIEVETNYN